ncbi:ATP-binding cassette domain-containing protein [Actinopolymorpha pittospori]|uniref:ABC-2 type transport system ATP-binding protein n=1 Tax=Actinopolymorpha pittospori TaxID=648752 RepID=A0A927R8C2_9ACTN|nr:ABC-2 type transport system ATP-binding protein [Actinopolymorpha pittospori]
MNALETTGLGRRFGRTWALRDCTLAVPAGRVAALVGSNGAGKTTLLHLAVGLLKPTHGQVRVNGAVFGRRGEDLARVAFVAQDKPLFASFTVEEMLRFGRAANPRFDTALARTRVRTYDIPLDRKVRRLSGGQRTLLALALALGKRADLLLLDEPLADLDPLARREVMGALMSAVAESGATVVLSSHVVADLADTCDYLVLLGRGRVQMSGDFDELTDSHCVLTGPADLADRLAHGTVVQLTRTTRQTTALVRGAHHDGAPGVSSRAASLEELVLAYMHNQEATVLPRPSLVETDRGSAA